MLIFTINNFYNNDVGRYLNKPENENTKLYFLFEFLNFP